MKFRPRLVITILCLELAVQARGSAQEPTFLSLPEVPVPVPYAAIVPVPPDSPPGSNPIPGPKGKDGDLDFRDLAAAGIVKDQAALIRLGKALFWDTQVGSDGVQACATCHFSAGADIRSRNQISPGLNDTNFESIFKAEGFTGDNVFGESAVPFTANDPNTPSPPGPSQPPPAKRNVPGFPQFKPNYQLTEHDFPLNDWFQPTERTPRGPGTTFFDEFANVRRDTNDVISSQGVRHTLFNAVKQGQVVDAGTAAQDIYNIADPGQLDLNTRVRRAEARNAPTVINAVFNFDNFWDGRASFIFNGVNPFGFRDRHSTLKQNADGQLRDVFLRVTNSSLASQAVGPPASNFEMSWENRRFPDIGKKMVVLRPLAQQLVHPDDSVLGPESQAHLDAQGNVTGNPGLRTATYADMIKAAFKNQWWDSDELVTPEGTAIARMRPSTNNPRTIIFSMGRGKSRKRGAPAINPSEQDYTQIEWNFSMFFGLAIQAYEATLVSDGTPFDRYQGAPSKGIKGDPNALTASERNGLAIFMNADPNLGGRCNNCHVAPVMTNHTVAEIQPDRQGRPIDIVEFMVMGDGRSANYDKGFYNIGVRRTSEDMSRAGHAPDATDPNHPELSPFANPLDNNNPFPLSYTALAGLAAQGKLPPDVLRFVQLDPGTKEPIPVLDRQAIHGNFKVPNLRNALYTGPYFHNGDSATLRHVVEFYTRGGNFPNTNFRDLDPDINGIPPLMFPKFLPNAEQNIRDLVNFVAHGLTDERVPLEKAPFDHPQLSVPNGAKDGAPDKDDTITIPPIGRNGRPAPVLTFLELDPQSR